MREITSHKVNGLNEALTIRTIDQPGPGGAYHEYEIFYEGEDDNGKFSHHTPIRFQKGPIKEAGVNGVSNEALLAIVKDRLECFQNGLYACDDNGDALHHVELAMNILHRRTKERMARGVEGTSEK